MDMSLSCLAFESLYGNLEMRKVFRARLLNFFKSHPELFGMDRQTLVREHETFKRSASETTLGRMFGSFLLLRSKEDNKGMTGQIVIVMEHIEQENSNPAKLRRNASAAANIDNLGSSSTPATAVHSFLVVSAVAAADLFLWRDKKLSAGLLGGATAIWILFDVLEYHVLSFVCHGLILVLTILFMWSNATTFINK
ncbi:reticulon-like protein b1 [Phtheirospermum japonicum]|uniref:Reticulon-like protein n=1 Tax=Phtheirospermum japonicum TaxID=374723 RepID=A0A830BFZ3_9LAMI|nr:reticulon-like protein b1 [Phtheirospermum japonicum]